MATDAAHGDLQRVVRGRVRTSPQRDGSHRVFRGDVEGDDRLRLRGRPARPRPPSAPPRQGLPRQAESTARPCPPGPPGLQHLRESKQDRRHGRRARRHGTGPRAPSGSPPVPAPRRTARRRCPRARRCSAIIADPSVATTPVTRDPAVGHTQPVEFRLDVGGGRVLGEAEFGMAVDVSDGAGARSGASVSALARRASASGAMLRRPASTDRGSRAVDEVREQHLVGVVQRPLRMPLHAHAVPGSVVLEGLDDTVVRPCHRP